MLVLVLAPVHVPRTACSFSKQDVITNRLYEQAEPLQVVGNSAAHGGPTITEEDAVTTLEVLRRVLEALYDDEKIGDDVKAKHLHVKKKP